MKQTFLALILFVGVALCTLHPIAYREEVPSGWTLGDEAPFRETIEFTILLK